MRTADTLGVCLLLALGGCSREPVCPVGTTRACYTAKASTKDVGRCRGGTQTCLGEVWGSVCNGEITPVDEICDDLDNDCDGETDEGAANPCGGCIELTGAPGARCGECGHYTCDGPEALQCIIEGDPGGPCVGSSGCPGTFLCSDGTVLCDAPAKNGCEVCGGPPVSGLGVTCFGTSGCSGVTVCDSTGTVAVCSAPKKNNCGACGKPEVPGVGEVCDATTGCEGRWVCNTGGDAAVCTSLLTPNECGLCGGPPVSGVGSKCVNAQSCEGTKVCSPTLDSAPCDAPAANNCGLCGGAFVPGVGVACTAASGCEGITVCNSGKNGTDCDGPPLCTPPDHVVISELATKGASAADEFVEFFNPTATAQDLSGALLYYRASTGTFGKMLTFPAGTVLPAGRYRLAVHGGTGNYSGATPGDDTFATSISSSAASIWLFAPGSTPGASSTPDGPDVLDMVGWLAGSPGEGGHPIPVDHPATGSFERKARWKATDESMSSGADALLGNGYDSEDNATDFVVRTTRDPQNSASPREPP